MKLIEFLDRVGERRLERARIRPHRPLDVRVLVGVLFFIGYYVLVFTMLKVVVPEENAGLVRDAMLVLGPVIGAIGQALFRTDVKDELQAQNTGEGFRAIGEQAKATATIAGNVEQKVNP